MDISCKKLNCIFNEHYHCTSIAVTVGSDLDCKTFERDENKGVTKFSNTLFEIGQIEQDFVEQENIKVECKAKKCLFNKAGICSASGISIIDGEKKKPAFCATNLKK